MTAGLPVHLGLLRAVTQLFSSLVEPVDVSTLHSIETIVIDWSHQIREILSKDSAQPLLEGLHPLPRAEFEFWRTRSLHLQCINEQVRPRRAVWPGCMAGLCSPPKPKRASPTAALTAGDGPG